MPWKESSAMDERLRFVQDVYRGVASFTELCARYGISRTARYGKLTKYAEGGPARLARRAPDRALPSIATVHRILARFGWEMGPIASR